MDPILWFVGHELRLKNIVRAENCFLYDEGGQRYVDLESGVWCTGLGHSHPRISAAIKAQLDHIGHSGYCYSHAVVEAAGYSVLEAAGLPGGACTFLCSGSEAVEFGVRAAQHLSPHPRLLTLADSYFGAYGSASKRASQEWHTFDWLACAQCPCSNSCDPACNRLAEIPFDQIGGFLFEPGSSSGLVRFPPVGVIATIARLIKEHDGFLLINEVTTGLGRTGTWFGFQHYRLEPDMVALGKGIGNGYPVSATLFSRQMAEKLTHNPLKYMQSHQNDPLGAAVVKTVIEVMQEEQLVERSRKAGEILLGSLERLAAGFAHIREIRGRGLMMVIEFNPAPGATAQKVHQELFEKGFIVTRRPGMEVLRIDPPLTIPLEELRCFVEVLAQILSDLR
jgi:acetylornithine/N-succinyldiaminopimelate aminotransferase